MAYIRSNSRYMLNDDVNVETFDKLPPGNYLVKFDSIAGKFFLEAIEPFSVPDRVYGSLSAMAKRVASTYEQRSVSTGALFTGEKGSGKSLLCRIVCAEAAKRGIPTLVVTSPWSGESFNQFIQGITQQCIVLFDEFEKVYDKKEDQDSMLSLLDGVFPTKKLFLMTCNDRYNIIDYMINRPGRLFYNIDFKYLDVEFIDDYCSENLADKSRIEEVVKVASMYERFNFDMLKALVEEMNRYSESAMEAVKWLNIKPIFGNRDTFEMSLKVNGSEVKTTEDEVYLDPLQSEKFHVFAENEDDEAGRSKHYAFSSANLTSIRGRSGEYVYANGDAVLTLKRVQTEHFSMSRIHAS